MKKTCFHCGLDVPEHLHLTVRYENEDRETCCAGCQAVAQSIIDAGLGSYYKQRTADAQKTELPPQEILDQIRLYDLPEVQSDFVETHGGTREAVLMLGGITCAACVWLIEQQLLRTDGIVRIDLNYSTHRCRVVWDDGKIRLSDILLKIRQIGYTAAPYDAQKIEAANQKERKQYIVRLAVAGLGMMQTMMFALPTYLYGGDIEPDFLQILHWGGFLMVLPVVFYCAVPFYQGALRDLKNRRVGMDTPITVAIIMTFIAGVYSLATNAGQGMYFESIAMLLFFLLGGRFMEHIARRKAGDAAERLVKLIPAFCHHMPDYPDTQETCEAAVVKLKAGDIVLVKPGETIPVDGTVLEGSSAVNESMLTGESLPVAKMPSEKVTAGTLNTQSPLIIRTDRTGGGTRLSHIVRLLDRALAQKPRTAELAEQYASSFIFGELLLAVPVFIGWALYADAHTALWITVALLVITCPCALSLATPTALAASTGTLAREGILIGGKQAIETLAQTTDIIFDKPGTLTQGNPAVRRISLLRGTDEAFVLAVAQALEQQSEHPLARAILNCRISDGSVPDIAIKQRLNRIGEGVGAQLTVNGETQVWALGRASYVAEISGKEPQTEGRQRGLPRQSKRFPSRVLPDRPLERQRGGGGAAVGRQKPDPAHPQRRPRNRRCRNRPCPGCRALPRPSHARGQTGIRQSLAKRREKSADDRRRHQRRARFGAGRRIRRRSGRDGYCEGRRGHCVIERRFAYRRPPARSGAAHPPYYPAKPDMGGRVQYHCRTACRFGLCPTVDSRTGYELQFAGGFGQRPAPSQTGENAV